MGFLPSDKERLSAWVARGLSKPGKTQVGLAKALGIQQSRIPEIKQGKRLIKAHEISVIAEYLEADPPNFGARSPDMEQLEAELAKIPENSRAQVVQTLLSVLHSFVPKA